MKESRRPFIGNLACQHVARQEGALAWELNIAGKVPAFQPYDGLTAGWTLNGKSKRRADGAPGKRRYDRCEPLTNPTNDEGPAMSICPHPCPSGPTGPPGVGLYAVFFG